MAEGEGEERDQSKPPGRDPEGMRILCGNGENKRLWNRGGTESGPPRVRRAWRMRLTEVNRKTATEEQQRSSVLSGRKERDTEES